MTPSETPPAQEEGTDLGAKSISVFVPLQQPAFRMLWSVWLAANICMWMNDVAAAWMMATLTSSPTWVALVQTASTLPVFILGLPSGALADTLDRRHYFIATQFWVAVVALLLSAIVFVGSLTPSLLLALLFANGIGLAMRLPVFAAIVPDLVPRPQLPTALALNSIAMNASRIIGPLIAGALISLAGSAYVFLFNAIVSICAGFVIMHWKRKHVPDPLGRERFKSAMRVGVQYVWQSSRLKAVLLHTFLFFFHSTAVLGLLPLVAKSYMASSAVGYTALLAAMGVGAIAVAILLPRLRMAITNDRLVLAGSIVQGLAALTLGLFPNLVLALVAMVLTGIAWISAGNALSVSAQIALPDWVRARGMSMFQMSVMGGSALGAAAWGHVATKTNVQTSLIASALTGVLAMVIAHLLTKNSRFDEDLTPSQEFEAPATSVPPRSGPVLVTIEYIIDSSYAEEFRALMYESRRSRLQQGALTWHLLHDIEEPERYIEQFIDESWADHLRRFNRLTAADIALRKRKRAFHTLGTPPRVRRYLYDRKS